MDSYKVLQLKISETSTVSHDLYMKKHSTRQICDDRPSDRTLFLLNVPPYATEQNLTDIFTEAAGPISKILFAENAIAKIQRDPELKAKFFPPKELFKVKVAFVVFKTSGALSKALALKTLPSLDCKNKILSGIEKWKFNYYDSMPTNDNEFQSDIDEFMAKFDKNEENEKNKKKTNDSDGWVTVGKKGVNSGFQQKESVITKLEEKVKNANKKKELLNFYSFQIREAKMKEIVSLRKKFEQDKQKIENMKKTRRFKPF